MVDQKKIYGFYEKISKSYSKCIFYEADTRYQKNILSNAKKYLNLSTESKLASIGCGNGGTEYALAKICSLKKKDFSSWFK